ncbi:hypothetical protein PoB_001160500 [Plakobranchus ocellatus]|uniref:Uncharacterized protein n=1 Tax=Plakobranchus ocellatus TaxID=259542 RepID=A0AAV3YPM6_9GAST|nr:hypothetical protein PoB_001160500 [Plakobranchus ocellatus]
MAWTFQTIPGAYEDISARCRACDKTLPTADGQDIIALDRQLSDMNSNLSVASMLSYLGCVLCAQDHRCRASVFNPDPTCSTLRSGKQKGQRS